MRFCMGGVYSPDAGKFICFSIVAMIAIVAFVVVGTCTNCPAFPVYILSEPLFWILGGILLVFLSPIFYLVYCAVCALWFPKREPGYPFESTQDDKTFRYSQHGNPHDRTQYFDEENKDEFEEELFEDILGDGLDDPRREANNVPRFTIKCVKHGIVEPDEDDYRCKQCVEEYMDKLVTARLERFHLSEDEAELIFGKKWRNKLSQGNFDLFYQITKMKLDLLGLNKSFGKKVSHIIDKVIQMIDTVYNENPEYAKSFETYAEESNPGAARTAKKAWEFFKKHKKTDGFDPSENILDTSEAYKIFDLAVSATVEQVKKKYRELVLKWHPDRYKGDKTVAEKMMMKINQAYETIMAAA